MIKREYYDSVEAWREGRKRGIGGSAVGTILGVNPWETAWEHWARLKGELPCKEENAAMKMGHLLEPVVVSLFVEETGASIDPDTAQDFTVVNDDYPYFVASPDRIGTLNGEPFVLECKTTQQRIDEDTLPKSWYCQLQFYMMVADIKSGAIAWLINGRDFGYRWFERDERFCEWMSSVLEEWWQRHIIVDEPPEVTAKDVDIAYPQSQATSVELSSEGYNAAIRLKDIRAEIKALETEEEQLVGYIKVLLKDNEVATFKGEKVATWKTSKPRESFDSKRFKEEHPEMVGDYTKVSPGTRTFLLKI